MHASLTVNSTWAGSDVELSLMSPSGHVYSRQSAPVDAEHELGRTNERWTVWNPEPGQWKVRLYAADVNEEGEKVTLRSGTTTTANNAPVASFTASITGRTLTLHATGSQDPDGAITDYAWDLGDVTLHGAKVVYTYPDDGSKSVGLIVRDNAGAYGFAARHGLVSSGKHYTFDGFRPPVSNDKVNQAEAGRTIPFKFNLYDAQGRAVTSSAPLTSYGFSGTGSAATFTLVRDGNQYVLTAQTPKAWVGTTRVFTLTLDDGATHTAKFSFR